MKIGRVLFLVSIILVISSVLRGNSSSLPSVQPMPPQMVEILERESGVAAAPSEMRDLLGYWEGEWISYGISVHPVRKVTLVIFRVDERNINFLYGTGDSPDSRYPGRWKKHVEEISRDSNGACYFQFYGAAAWIRFTWAGGKLSGTTGFYTSQYMADFRKVGDLK